MKLVFRDERGTKKAEFEGAEAAILLMNLTPSNTKLRPYKTNKFDGYCWEFIQDLLWVSRAGGFTIYFWIGDKLVQEG